MEKLSSRSILRRAFGPELDFSSSLFFLASRSSGSIISFQPRWKTLFLHQASPGQDKRERERGVSLERRIILGGGVPLSVKRRDKKREGGREDVSW